MQTCERVLTPGVKPCSFRNPRTLPIAADKHAGTRTCAHPWREAVLGEEGEDLLLRERLCLCEKVRPAADGQAQLDL
eukprot:363525-Chlamydomonas_euryale.AAC.2